jgi:hypothetical protein
MRLPLALTLLLAAAPASAAVDPFLVGRWLASLQGMQMDLEVAADGRCTLGGDAGRCSTQGNALTFKGPDEPVTFQWRAAGEVLHLSGGDLDAPLAFQRQGGAGAGPGRPAADGAASRPEPRAAPQASAPPPSSAPPAAPIKASGPGTTVDRPGWGVTLTLPPGWRSADRDGLLLVGSDTEAGAIMVRFLPRATRADLLSGYQAGLQENGFVARPVAAATEFESRGGQALAGVLEGQRQDGVLLRFRTVGVLSRYGGALVVTGVTTTEHYPTLAARTEAVARAVAFREPPRTAQIAGDYQFVYVSKSGSYSREARVTLCQSGRFTRSGEMAGAGSAGSAVTSNRNGGTWQAVGDAFAGTITLTFGDGTVTSLPYRASQDPKDRSAYGPALRVGDTLYQKTGPGGC